MNAPPPRPRPLRRLAAMIVALGLGWIAAVAVAYARVAFDKPDVSRSVGSPGAGRLEHGHPIPPRGTGFVTYSYLGSALGRQYVHGALRDLLVEALAACVKMRPDRRFVIGETGWPRGGPLWPHRSHQNGLSLDVFVPLRDASGTARQISTWPWDRFGYGHDLDDQGRLGELHLDFDDLAMLLLELGARAPAFGLRLSQVLLAPELVPHLLASPTGRKLGSLAAVILRRPSWSRHDEHVHLDFALARPR